MPKRVNIRISDSLDTWFKVHSDDMGIPKSAMMAMALQQYATQYQSINSLRAINELVEQEMNNQQLKIDVE